MDNCGRESGSQVHRRSCQEGLDTQELKLTSTDGISSSSGKPQFYLTSCPSLVVPAPPSLWEAISFNGRPTLDIRHTFSACLRNWVPAFG